MKCINCSKSIPEMPEDSSYEELLCNQCYEAYLKEVELIEKEVEEYDDLADPRYDEYQFYRRYR